MNLAPVVGPNSLRRLPPFREDASCNRASNPEASRTTRKLRRLGDGNSTAWSVAS